MRRLLVGLLVAGCTPGAGSGLGDVGARPFRDHGFATFELPLLAEGFEVETDDPDVLRPLTPEDLEAELPPTTAWFQAGHPGFALVTLVDPTTGEEVDTVEVEV